MISKMSLEFSLPVVHATVLLLLLLLQCSSSWTLVSTTSLVVIPHHHKETTTNLGNSTATMIRHIERERQALLHFRHGLVDPHGILASWGSPYDEDQYHHQDCCQWRGVQCSKSSGHVISLDLRATKCDEDGYCINALKGKIGSSLLVLDHLSYLDLSGNDFLNYPIPKFIGSLVSLTYLNLSYSNLSGEIPPQFKNLSNLQSLDLSGYSNDLHAQSLAWASTFSSLKTLDLSWLELTNATDWVHIINSLPSLTYLNLKFCFLPNPTPLWRVNLTFLSYLDISFNKLQGPIPKEIFNLSFLSYLDLSANQLQGSMPKEFVNLNYLSHIDLSGNQLHGPVPETIVNLNSLAYLGLNGYNLQGSIPDAIFNLSSLSSLYLSSTQLQGSIPDAIFNLSSFSSLDLSNNQLQGTISDAIFNLSSLSSLYLSNNQLQGPIFEGIGYLSSLSHLDLSYNQFIGGIPNSFCRSFYNLEQLQLSGCKLTGDLLSLLELLSECIKNSLRSLSLDHNNLFGPLPDFTRFPSLRELDLSFNQFNGSFPSLLNKHSSLESLYLGNNQIIGSFPDNLGLLPELEELDLSSNLLNGTITESHLLNLSNLMTLDLSLNKLLSLNISPNWTPPFQFNCLFLDSCRLGPHFPNWLQAQHNLEVLSISDAGIADTLPGWLWGLFIHSHSSFVNLSHNEIRGTLPDLRSQHLEVGVIDLSYNFLEGSVPSFFTQVGLLDLSNNKLSGSISSWSLEVQASTELESLDLTNNNLSGELPECWMHMSQLKVLNLGNNSFSGNIPNSFGNLNLLEVLDLSSNKLSGEVPLSLKYCTSLQILDLSENFFSGQVPYWFGNNLVMLNILILRQNEFFGSLPWEICHLRYIQVLDLSLNNINGTIPNCLYCSTYLSKEVNLSQTYYNLKSSKWTNIHAAVGYLKGGKVVGGKIDIHGYLVWKGSRQEYWKNLALVQAVDLSSNKLTGEIPLGISYMFGVRSLNLSRNHLTGPITPKLGLLKDLESLDLSRNELFGEIPISFSNLNFLSTLDLSYNNLSGKIPLGTQLQSFNESAYTGNSGLCGTPLLKKCEKAATQNNHDHGEKAEDQDAEFLFPGLYISIGLGFITGFWAACGTLLLKRSWRYAYFRFCYKLYDKILVAVVVYVVQPIARFQTQ